MKKVTSSHPALLHYCITAFFYHLSFHSLIIYFNSKYMLDLELALSSRVVSMVNLKAENLDEKYQ